MDLNVFDAHTHRHTHTHTTHASWDAFHMGCCHSPSEQMAISLLLRLSFPLAKCGSLTPRIQASDLRDFSWTQTHSTLFSRRVLYHWPTRATHELSRLGSKSAIHEWRQTQVDGRETLTHSVYTIASLRMLTYRVETNFSILWVLNVMHCMWFAVLSQHPCRSAAADSQKHIFTKLTC